MMEHLQSEEPFSSDPYFSNYLKDLKSIINIIFNIFKSDYNPNVEFFLM